MIEDIAEDLLKFGKKELGDDFRAVAHYGRDFHNPIYIRHDLREVIDEEKVAAFRIPTWQFQRSALYISRLFEGREDPEVVIRSYSDHHVLQFPLLDTEGILFSFDCEGEIPNDVLVGSKNIVYGFEGKMDNNRK